MPVYGSISDVVGAAEGYGPATGQGRSTSDLYLDISGGLATSRAKAGEQTYKTGLGTAGKATDYWSAILGGDKQKTAEAVEPERYQVGKAFQAGRQAISMGPRGGGTSSALAESRFEEAGAIGRLVEGQRPEAAKGLADVGLKEAYLGQSDIQTAESSLTNIFGNLLGAYTSFYAGKPSTLSSLGESAGQLIGMILMGGSGGGE